jgi:hypothetical protein
VLFNNVSLPHALIMPPPEPLSMTTLFCVMVLAASRLNKSVT